MYVYVYMYTVLLATVYNEHHGSRYKYTSYDERNGGEENQKPRNLGNK